MKNGQLLGDNKIHAQKKCSNSVQINHNTMNIVHDGDSGQRSPMSPSGIVSLNYWLVNNNIIFAK